MRLPIEAMILISPACVCVSYPDPETASIHLLYILVNLNQTSFGGYNRRFKCHLRYGDKSANKICSIRCAMKLLSHAFNEDVKRFARDIYYNIPYPLQSCGQLNESELGTATFCTNSK